MAANNRRPESHNDGAKRQAEVSTGAYKRQSEERLVLGGFTILLVAGGLLTTLLMGTSAAILAVGVILMFFGVLLALYLGFSLLEAWLKRE